MDIIPATELDAVNVMLRSIGGTSITSLSGTVPLDAAEAQNTIQEVVRSVCTKSWHWNTEYFTLTPDIDGYINLPTNTLAADTVDESQRTLVEKRGDKLYNLTPYQSGFIWDSGTVVDVELVLGLEYDLLPAIVQEYVFHRAARIFVARQEGDQIALRNVSQEEQLAMANMRREENRKRPRNARNNASMQQVLARGADINWNDYGTRVSLHRRYRNR